jgi:hypothetical protein
MNDKGVIWALKHLGFLCYLDFDVWNLPGNLEVKHEDT